MIKKKKSLKPWSSDSNSTRVLSEATNPLRNKYERRRNFCEYKFSQFLYHDDTYAVT